MKKLIALLMALLMATTMMTMAMADGETTDDTTGTTTAASAYTAVQPNENAPGVTHTLTLTNGVESLAYEIRYTFTVGDVKVMQPSDIPETQKAYAVEGAPSINEIVYDSTDGEFTTKTKNLVIYWSGVQIKQPGVYRWPVTIEKKSTDPNEQDSTSIAYLYAYAIDNNGKLMLDSCGWTTAADLNSAEGKGNLTDEYPSTFKNLTIVKNVEGLQGSKDQYFQFEIKLTTPANYGKTEHKISGSYQTSVPATAYHTEKTNPSTVTVTAGGTEATVTLWLKHGQNATIEALPYGTMYTITEASSGYDVSIAVAGDTANVTNEAPSVSDTGLNADATVTYTNTKTPTVPTGVDLQTTAPVVCLLMAMGLMFMAFAGKRKEETV